MPLLEIVLVGDYFGQQIVNRWNYLGAGTPAAVSWSFALAYAFGAGQDQTPPNEDTIVGKIATLQVAAGTLRECIVRDVYSVTDFYDTPFIPPIAGTATGDGEPPFVAAGFRTSRVRSDIRRGTKRFVGLNEASVEAGGVLSAGALAAFNALGTLMSDVLEYDDEGNTLTFTPVIVGREKVVVPGSDPVRYEYKYYETEAEQLDHLASSIVWEAYTTTRSQTSRQYGKGS